MASLTIRNLDPAVKARLRILAAKHGRSMEEEARMILRNGVLTQKDRPVHMFDSIRAKVASLGGFDDFELPPREPAPEPIKFDP